MISNNNSKTKRMHILTQAYPLDPVMESHFPIKNWATNFIINYCSLLLFIIWTPVCLKTHSQIQSTKTHSIGSFAIHPSYPSQQLFCDFLCHITDQYEPLCNNLLVTSEVWIALYTLQNAIHVILIKKKQNRPFLSGYCYTFLNFVAEL